MGDNETITLLAIECIYAAKNFKENTGFDLFEESLVELDHYSRRHQFYLTLIGFEQKDLSFLWKIIPEPMVDFLTIVNYEVTRSRKNLSAKNPAC